ncbi:MAG: TOBE domain-containing protein, partial [Methyloceanibacter sp.]|nr:TOBE domain-containing protein [Methyloceanibacter sp.]
GTPEEVYRTPNSRFVASFLGQSNLLPGTVTALAQGIATVKLDGGQEIKAIAPDAGRAGVKVTVIVRAQRLNIAAAANGATNRLFGTVAATSYLGGNAIYAIAVGPLKLQANNVIDGEVFREGDAVVASFEPSDCTLLGEDDRRL